MWEDVEQVIKNVKVPFKIETICKYSYAGDPKNNNIKVYEGHIKSVYEDDDILKYDNNEHIFAMDYVSSKAGDSSLNSLDNTLQFQKM